MSTLLRTIDEITLVGIYDRGEPNAERIAYRAQRPVNLAEYIVCLAATHPDGTVAPLTDRMLWLGGEQIDAGYWIFIYTGPGERRITKTTGGEPAIVIHWGQRQTILTDQRVVPVMFHLDGILTARSAETLGELLKHLTPGPPMPPTMTFGDMVKAMLAATSPVLGLPPPSSSEWSPDSQTIKRLVDALSKKSSSGST